MSTQCTLEKGERLVHDVEMFQIYCFPLIEATRDLANSHTNYVKHVNEHYAKPGDFDFDAIEARKEKLFERLKVDFEVCKNILKKRGDEETYNEFVKVTKI